jgi:1,2-diacylglycerol 3-alpha-glucosyltransferase
MNVSSSPGVLAGNNLSVGTRVAILFYRFGPYHHARLNAAGQLMSVWGVEACAMEDIYAWVKVEGAGAFTRVTLTDRDTGDRAWRQELQRKMWRALDEIKPQVVVIPGWSLPDALSGLSWGVARKVPVVIMSESTAWDEPRKPWKEWIKNRLVRMCSAGLAGGTPHADYLAQLGLPRDRIFLGYDIVDNNHFATGAAESRKQKTERKKQLGLPGKYFLASARFIEKKNLVLLIEAYAEYRKLASKSEIWDLVLLGDGPLKPSLLKLISSLDLESCIHLPGFKQYDELPVYLGLAETFIHASTIEQWGLVVNEAMASGLPMLVSNRCGCAQDLVRDGVNGFTFDPGNRDELTQLMLKISAPEFPVANFGLESQRIIAQWGPERFANELKAAATIALKARPATLHFMDRIVFNALLRLKI